MLSQALSSGGNFLCLIFAAKTGTAADLGAVAFAVTIYLVASGASRALISDPLLIRHQSDHREFSDRKSSSAAFYIGCSFSLAIAAIQTTFVLFGFAVRPEVVWLFICLPLLLFLDSRRYQFFAINRPRASAVTDGAWVLLFMIGLALRKHPRSLDIWQSWCVSGAAVGLVVTLHARGFAGFRTALAWLKLNLDLGGRFLAESLSSGLAVSLSLTLFSARTSPIALGSIRAAISLFGPLVVIYLGTQSVLLGLAQRSAKHLRSVARQSTGIMILAAAGLTILLLALPERLGLDLLGKTWIGTREQILLIGLATIAAVSSTGAVLGLRALGAATASLRARLMAAPLAILAPVSAGLALGEQGFGVGYAAANIFTSSLLWSSFRRESRASLGAYVNDVGKSA